MSDVLPKFVAATYPYHLHNATHYACRTPAEGEMLHVRDVRTELTGEIHSWSALDEVEVRWYDGGGGRSSGFTGSKLFQNVLVLSMAKVADGGS